MSERSHYPAGVPCWVDVLAPNPDAAKHFYGGLFGWEFAGRGEVPGDPPGEYFVARLNDRDVAGLASQPTGASDQGAAWLTHVAVENVEDAVSRAQRAGGSVLLGPLDAAPAGRLAVLSDPTGAVFCVWEPALRQGAQLVNEPSAWAMSMLQTTDPAAASAFYADVFGWQEEPFAAGEVQVTLWRRPGYFGGEPQQPVPRDVVAGMIALPASDGSVSKWSVDFWIEDAEEAAKRARGLGGSVLEGPSGSQGFRRAVLADADGAVFTVSQLVA